MGSAYVKLTVARCEPAFNPVWVPMDVRIDSIACIREKRVRRDRGMGYEDGAAIDVVGLGTLFTLEDPIRIKAAIAREES